MSHSSGGVIHLDDSDANAKEVGLDLEEVVTWDHKLRGTKKFSMGLLILSGRRFELPNLAEQQKILLNFINQPAHDYFLSSLPQATSVEEFKIVCKLGWKASTVTRTIKSGMCILLRSIWLFCWCFDVRLRRRRRYESRQSESFSPHCQSDGMAPGDLPINK
jgi:hypothetical protein